MKDAYCLKWFRNYFVEVDSDDIEKLNLIGTKLRRQYKWRFIKFTIVPKGIVGISSIKNRKGRKNKKWD